MDGFFLQTVQAVAFWEGTSVGIQAADHEPPAQNVKLSTTRQLQP